MEQGSLVSTNNNDTPQTEISQNVKQSQSSEIKVKVALRVRPFISKEIVDNEQKCMECFDKTNQVQIGKDKAFTFDKVFDTDSTQAEIYKYCAKELVESCLSGYNATILAYGQTGSGKTYTMGSNITYEAESENSGIILRVMKDLFAEIQTRKSKSEFLIRVSFLEIYNEDIKDLLDTSTARFRFNQAYTNKNPLAIREEKDGSISVYGAKEEKVTCYEEMAACLEKGSLHRSTASTLMNETSSRSHAIFTISVEQHQIDDLYQDPSMKKKTNGDANFTTAKFHFVDLAGSERLKKTGASGMILKEGININRGLLALGNVISALSDLTGKVSHVPYRESKLTRILQDSLGGNSRTFMIACVSPAESNFDESLNTLKYASRARNIKNKPIVNTDPQSTIISNLKQQVFELQNQLLGYKRLFSSAAKDNYYGDAQALASLIAGSSSSALVEKNDELDEMKSEMKDMKIKLVQYEKELARVNTELHQTKSDLNQSEISMYSVQKERDLLKLLNEKYQNILETNNIKVSISEEELDDLGKQTLVDEYSKTIEKLRQELKDKEKVNEEIRKEYESLIQLSTRDQELLLERTKQVENLANKMKRQEHSLSRSGAHNIQLFNEKLDAIDNSNALGRDYETENKFIEDADRKNSEGDEIDREYEMNIQVQNKELALISGNIAEKEELLKGMTQNQLLIERNLIDEMKNQYYKKVAAMENEIKQLEKQRDEFMSKPSHTSQESEKTKTISTYKQKISELELRLRDFKKKDKEQQNLNKIVETQKNKIHHLDDEIKKIKNQKLALHKKIKEEADRFERLKNARQKELLDAKKSNIEKDMIISKLKTENRKKDFIYKKQADELLSKYMSKELYGQIKSEANRGNVSSRRKRNLTNSMIVEEMNNSSFDANQTTPIGEEDAKQLIDFCTEGLLDNLRLSFRIEKEEDGMRATEEELEVEKNKYAELVLRRDKLEIERRNCEDIDLEHKLSVKSQEIDLELNEISTRIENLETKFDFQLTKINELTEELTKKPRGVAEQALLNNDRINKNPGNTKLVLRCLFGKYISASLDIIKLHEKISHSGNEVTEVRKRAEEAEQRLKLNELQYEISLTKLNKEYEKNQLLLIKEQLYEEREYEAEQILNSNEENAAKSYPSIVTNSPRGYKTEDLLSPNQGENGKEVKNVGQDKGRTDKSSNFKRESMILSNSPGKKNLLSTSTSNLKMKPNTDTLAEQNKKLQKIIEDLTRNKVESDKAFDSLKRKHEVLQVKYDQLKKPGSQKQNTAEEASGTPKNTQDQYTSLPIDKSQYSTNASMSNNSSFSMNHLNTNRRPEEGDNTNRQKSDKDESKTKGLSSLASLRDKRKEKRANQSGSDAGSKGSEAPVPERTRSGTITEATIGKISTIGQQTQRVKKLSTPLPKVQKSPKIQVSTPTEGTSSAKHTLSRADSLSSEYKMEELDLKEENKDEDLFRDTFEDEPQEDSNAWICQASIESAHNNAIYYMTSLGNMLYSSSLKTFKVWSLDTMTCISEVMTHSSAIKSIAIWPEKNLLATACDKVVSLWDLVSLQNVGTLRGHKDEIKTLHVCDDILFSGGKGSSTYNALLAWDLRSLSPMEEKEKDQEIVTMISYNKILYYGNQNHQIRSVDLSTMQSLAPFEPSHKESITSLAVVKDHLVSASKDSSLRLWDLNHHILNLKHTWISNKDYINVIESNTAQDLLYSGSKGGVIKVWGVENEKLRCAGSMIGHTQSVNSICKLYDEYEEMFASCSSDRSIKVWKPCIEEAGIFEKKANEAVSKTEELADK